MNDKAIHEAELEFCEDCGNGICEDCIDEECPECDVMLCGECVEDHECDGVESTGSESEEVTTPKPTSSPSAE